MKNERKLNGLDGLLNTVVADDDWLALNASLKREALTAMGVARRRRRLQVVLCQAACAVALFTGVTWWLRSSVPSEIAVTPRGSHSVVATKGQFISEEEMLEAFPPGSCVVAEIDGQKTLVFFDAKGAAEGFALSHR